MTEKLKTYIDRLEPNINTTAYDQIALISIAFSLKRIADSIENIPNAIQLSIQEAIWNATKK